jgi:hypothetical protein
MAKRKSAAKKATRKSMKKAAPAGAAGRGKVSAAGKKTAKAAKKSAKKAAKAAKRPAKKAAKKAAKASKAPAKKMMKATKATKAAAPKKAVKKAAKKKAPGTDRASIPSSLNLEQPSSSSSAKTGRKAQREQLKSHTESSPALTGGDVDANWEGAYSSGDEAPGGDNPTPDQDVVDDIGHALGVEYEDDEELKGAPKITERDKHRWELNPASSEDYKERK